MLEGRLELSTSASPAHAPPCKSCALTISPLESPLPLPVTGYSVRSWLGWLWPPEPGDWVQPRTPRATLPAARSRTAPGTRRGHFQGDQEAPMRATLLGLRESRNPVVRGSKPPGKPEVGDELAHIRYFSLRKWRCPLLPGVLVAPCDPGPGGKYCQWPRNQGWDARGLSKPLPTAGGAEFPAGPGEGPGSCLPLGLR